MYVLTFVLVRLDNLLDNDFSLDMTVSIDMGFGDLTRQLHQSSPRPGRLITEETSPQHASMTGLSPYFENSDLDMFCYINVELELTRNLPWFRLQNLMEQPGWHCCSLFGFVNITNTQT
jgi:hypothetical protein